MRRHIFAFLAVETIAIALYAWQSISWFGWKHADPGIFSGSPDAHYLYGVAQQWSGWLEGLVAGLLVGALTLAFAASPQVTRDQRPIASLLVICLLPAIALIAANVAFLLHPAK
jgi:fructose-specific phosphotransferase system IIC component